MFPYCRKLAAASQFSKLLEFGFPNLETRSPSEVTVCIEPTGPFSNAPAIAPIDVATAGTTFVKSTSFTCTPGDTKILFLYLYL